MLHHRKRNRMIGFDYSSNAIYFVTSCVKNRIHFFGEIVNGKMVYTDAGIIANEQWDWLINQYPYINSHSFIVMPNHIHAVLEINSNFISDDSIKIKSLSELMGAYKTTSAKRIRLSGCAYFQWQRSFHDHIIKSGDAYRNIMNYIETNDVRWKEDCFHTSIS